MTLSKKPKVLNWAEFQDRLPTAQAAFLLAQVRLPQPDRPSPGWHCHDFAELFWVVSGRGQQGLSGGEVALEAGQAYFLRPEQAHWLAPRGSDGLRFINLAFPRREWDLVRNSFGEMVDGFWPKGPRPRRFKLTPSTTEWMETEARVLAGGRQDRTALFAFLLGLFQHLRPNPGNPFAVTAPPWLASAYREFCQPENLAGGVARFAELAGRRPETLSRVIRDETGARAIDLVNRCRMEHAACELRMTDRTILDVGWECGFEGSSQFCKAFKEHYGESPGKYRKRFGGVA